jgi:hypothetical protein
MEVAKPANTVSAVRNVSDVRDVMGRVMGLLFKVKKNEYQTVCCKDA